MTARTNWTRCRECGKAWRHERRPGPRRVTCSDECHTARRRRLAAASDRRIRAARQLEANNAIAAALGEPLAARPASGRYTPLDPDTVRAIAAAMARTRRGDGSAELVARRLGINVRTVYRWTGATVVDVNLGQWTAPFAVRPGDPPTQLAEWRGVTRLDRTG